MPRPGGEHGSWEEGNSTELDQLGRACGRTLEPRLSSEQATSASLCPLSGPQPQLKGEELLGSVGKRSGLVVTGLPGN